MILASTRTYLIAEEVITFAVKFALSSVRLPDFFSSIFAHVQGAKPAFAAFLLAATGGWHLQTAVFPTCYFAASCEIPLPASSSKVPSDLIARSSKQDSHQWYDNSTLIYVSFAICSLLKQVPKSAELYATKRYIE